jgi:hypothetical protein
VKKSVPSLVGSLPWVRDKLTAIKGAVRLAYGCLRGKLLELDLVAGNSDQITIVVLCSGGGPAPSASHITVDDLAAGSRK